MTFYDRERLRLYRIPLDAVYGIDFTTSEKHEKFFKSHKNQSVKVRIQFLKKLKKELLARENNIYEALYNDLKKPIFESYTSEFLMVQKVFLLLEQ